MEKPLADSNPMLHFQIRTPSTAVRPPTTLFHGLLVEDVKALQEVYQDMEDDKGTSIMMSFFEA